MEKESEREGGMEGEGGGGGWRERERERERESISVFIFYSLLELRDHQRPGSPHLSLSIPNATSLGESSFVSFQYLSGMNDSERVSGCDLSGLLAYSARFALAIPSVCRCRGQLSTPQCWKFMIR